MTISGTIKEWFTVSVYGMVGKDEVVFSKEVHLKSALDIPEGKVTEIDVELLQESALHLRTATPYSSLMLVMPTTIMTARNM